MALLGLDIGTTEVKAAAYSETGVQLAFASAEQRPVFPGSGRAELVPEELCAVVDDVIRRVAAQTSHDPVRAIAISSHGETFVPIGADDKPAGPFILNIDSRAEKELAEFVDTIGRRRLYDLTGLPVHPMYTLPKILWLRKHEPALFKSTRLFLCIEDYFVHRLGVDPVISMSLASRTAGMNLNTAQWSDELLQATGISSGQLARPAASGQEIGKLPPALARQLNLPREASWVTGGHDQACCALGAGCLVPGTAVDGTGTFECMSIPSYRPLLSPTSFEANLPCGRHILPNGFISLAYAPGGVVLKWLRDQLSRDKLELARSQNLSAYDLMLDNMPDHPTGLFVYPHLLGTGTPWLDAKASGSIHGITVGTTYEILVKAALEGVTYEMCWNLEVLRSLGVKVETVYAVGGGARSAVWLQLKADIFGCEVVTVQGEASCLGAALCAGVGSGIYGSWEEAVAAAVRAGKVYQPRPEIYRRYQELFENYKEIAGRVYGYKLSGARGNTNN